ncbi:MAG: MalY/PatB family protein [Acutalibacteraceae bacterium]
MACFIFMEAFMSSFSSDYFDTVYDRHTAGDIKYQAVPGVENVIPMWIADMDFKAPPAVKEALINSANHGIFGYTQTDEEYDNLIISWYKRRMDWSIKPEWILKSPGVMFAVSAAIRALTDEGDSVIICQPVYYPFAKIVSANKRKLVVSELRLENGQYKIDFCDLENKIRQNSVKVFLLCSPHNPVGRVWTRDELSEIGRICCKYNVIIISDEIHSDFVYGDRRHIPIATLSEEISDRTVTCTSPSKTFNLAGLQASDIIISNSDIRGKVHRALRATGYGELNTMAIAATKAVYKDGEAWLDALLSYLQENICILGEACTETGGEISLIQPEGTYLMWLDCRRLGLSDIELADFFLKKAGVRLHNGSTFGAGGNGFVRMNIACPKSVLRQALSQITNAINNL